MPCLCQFALKWCYGTFPKAFFQEATSQWYFPKWQLSKCAISQTVISKVCPSPKHVLAADRGPLAHPCTLRRLKRPNLTFGKLPLGKMYIWEVATWEVVTWEVALKKMSLVNYLEPLHLFSMNYLVSMDRPF